MSLGKYVDPFTDFGFKRLFGTEANKDLLIEFLNVLLDGKKIIKDLTFSNNEQISKSPDARKAFFDLFCIADNGERFIIELQRIRQQYFQDRVIYYATYPIHEVGRKGDNHWNYQLPEIFLIGMMDFEFDHSPKSIFHHHVKLMELTTKEVFYDKLTFIFLEMPKFVKREEELETSFDKWMFMLKYLRDFQQPPTVLEGNPFDKIFNIASIANLNKEEMNAYEASLKQQRDWNSALAYAEMKGREEGHELGREEGHELGREEGLELGREEGLELGLEKGIELGLEKGREETLEKVKKAIALIKRGYQKSEIADLSGLSSKELDELFE